MGVVTAWAGPGCVSGDVVGFGLGGLILPGSGDLGAGAGAEPGTGGPDVVAAVPLAAGESRWALELVDGMASRPLVLVR